MNHPHNPDLLKPNMPEMEQDENQKEENDVDDTEMKEDEDEERIKMMQKRIKILMNRGKFRS